MTSLLDPAVVGDGRTLTFTGKDSAGNAEDITGNTIDFRAYDDDGNAIVKSTSDGITILTQSGATLGQARITIDAADWPAAWLAIPPRETKQIFVEVQRTISGVPHTPIQTKWKIVGQAIT